MIELAAIYDNFFFDCDGVVWRAEESIENALPMTQQLERMGKKVFFLTNDATKTTAQIADKLSRLGQSSVHNDHVYTLASLVP